MSTPALLLCLSSRPNSSVAAARPKTFPIAWARRPALPVGIALACRLSSAPLPLHLPRILAPLPRLPGRGRAISLAGGTAPPRRCRACSSALVLSAPPPQPLLGLEANSYIQPRRELHCRRQLPPGALARSTADACARVSKRSGPSHSVYACAHRARLHRLLILSPPAWSAARKAPCDACVPAEGGAGLR